MVTNTNKTTLSTTIMPFLVVKNGIAALEFYKTAFGASIMERYDNDNGKLIAKLDIDGAAFCIGDEEAEFDNHSPETIGGSPVRVIITAADPDAIYDRAITAGATQICPVTTEEDWRIGKLKDPFGHIWEIGHPL